MSTVATARVYGAGCSARRSRANRRAEARHTASQPSMTASPAWAPSVADGHPSDRHHGARLEARAQVDRGVHSHFAAAFEHGAVEDRGARGHEHLVRERRAGDVAARPDQAVVPDRARMLGARPDDGVFHDDCVAPNPDGTTGLADEARAVQDAYAR